jgi:hypothetical protein
MTSPFKPPFGGGPKPGPKPGPGPKDHGKHEDHCKKRKPKHCKPHHHPKPKRKHCG